MSDEKKPPPFVHEPAVLRICALHAEHDAPREGARGYIQWKGTQVCMDAKCACGAGFHFDREFLYRWRCTFCGRRYLVGEVVRFIELTPEDADMIEAWDPGTFQEADDEHRWTAEEEALPGDDGSPAD